ncbi:MAG: N-acyl homoserine lactonase family protein [Actinomycetota bacterium]|nr:N-acyl homoserine lactonase family protein [Actinomycetota bacterium]
MELFVLPLGACCCNYEVIAPGVRDARRFHIPVYAYLVRCDDDRLLLVDTGMSRVHVEDPDATWRGTPTADALIPVMRKEDTLVFRLAQLGCAPQDIDYVVNTHLHFDHAGNNDLLGRATFFVQRDQYEHAKGNPSFPNQYWNLPSLRYELLEGDCALFDGIEVRHTPGHCTGHQSLVLELPETGTVVVCGDAVYCQDNFDYDAWDGQADPATARESAYRLRSLADERDALMIYGHDPAQVDELRLAPGTSYR